MVSVMNLIAVGYAALVDVVEVVHVQPSFWLALQTHGVTQNQGQHLSPFPCLDGEAAELWSDKKHVEGSNGSYLQSLFIIHRRHNPALYFLYSNYLSPIIPHTEGCSLPPG